MADDPFVPCREWLGIEPVDLALPHRLLGIDAAETDPLAIVRAADRRLTALRAAGAERAAERDALVAQVEAARDALLADCVRPRAAAIAPPPVPGVPAAPPVPSAPPPAPAPGVPPPSPAATAAFPLPPPVPPPVPPAVVESPAHATFSGDAITVSRRRVVHRDRSDGVATALGVTALVIAAAAAAIYVAWPQLGPGRRVARTRDPASRPDARPPSKLPAPQPVPDAAREPTRDRRPESKPRPQPEAKPERSPEPQPAPRPTPTPPPDPRPAPEPTRGPARDPTPPTMATREPAPAPAPASEPVTEAPPAIDVEQVRTAVGAAITKGFESLRRQEFAAAKRAFDAVADQALDDQQATDRLQRWRQFLLYAEQYPEYRDQALASAASTAATYDLGSRQVAVVEFTPREFIYRDSRRPGRNLRVPRDAIPSDVELALVEQWFARDGRAANHLFLGAAALARREPDLAAARREWQAAAAGGEPHGTLLLALLDDPVVRGR